MLKLFLTSVLAVNLNARLVTDAFAGNAVSGRVSCDDFCHDGGHGRGVPIGTAPFCEGTCGTDCADGNFCQEPWSEGAGCWTGHKICCCSQALVDENDAQAVNISARLVMGDLGDCDLSTKLKCAAVVARCFNACMNLGSSACVSCMGDAYKTCAPCFKSEDNWPAERIQLEQILSTRLENCGSTARKFCCDVGNPCDCNKGINASGQCSQYSYGYCCTVGTPCDCAGEDEHETLPEPEYQPMDSAERAAIERLFSGKLGNCGSTARKFCCEVGNPCDCDKGIHAAGQCSQYSYGYCCTVGTPCDCAGEDEAENLELEPEYQPMDPAERAAIERLFSGKLGNCGQTAWTYCCAVGNPCDCNKGIHAAGQCSQSSYGYCCTVGIPCVCAVEDEAENLELEPEYQLMDPAERAAIERLFSGKLGNCGQTAWSYCCAVGNPCDCDKGIHAAGQCSQYSYGYCCTLGTPCVCAVGGDANKQSVESDVATLQRLEHLQGLRGLAVTA